MNQARIGAFISQCRKAKGWTQNRLGEQLGVTDKAVSKWERGKSMPDLSLFLPLCSLLDITLNELLLGEHIPQEAQQEKSNELLMEVIANWIGARKEEPLAENGGEGCILSLEHVKKFYTTETSSTAAINDISFQVAKGSFVGIMGASGSGKTTLLNLIATIDKPTAGSILINGQNIGEISDSQLALFRREHLGFVFQEYNLLETLTIYENIALALTIRETPGDMIRRTILALAEKLKISSILQKYPYEVSGGQRQRCACARAMAVNPSLILADEPTGALDSHATRQLLDTFLMLRRDYGATILMVTHDALSASYCDKILFLQDGEIRAALEGREKTKQEFFTDILDMIAQIEEE